jgi:energy-coupling factor transporter ATP-binding protein EcfA2
MSETEGMSDLVDEFQSAAIASQLRTDYAIVYRFVSSLLAKRFLIATGLSGSGKTKLAQAFARWLTPDPGYVSPTDKTKGKNPNPFYKVVSVGADWSGNENILGYPNGLHPEEYFTKPALELILHAKKDEHKNDPHFLILDEMNLSHVERYFADILSAIESDEKIHLHRDKERKVGDEPIEQEIDLPKNLFIIGTVNIDETTHMFSPKVLDRANVIEFRMKDTELEFFLENPLKPDLNKLDGKGEAFGQAFVDAAKNPTEVPEDARTRFQCEMLLFFKVLQKHGAEFGYRVTHEAGRFVSFYKAIGSESDVETWFKEAFDSIIVQKFLPKLHGSESKLRGVLFSLAHLCSKKREWTRSTLEDNKKLIKDSADEAIQKGINNSSSDDSPTQVLAKVLGGEFEKAHYPLSFEKIERMWRGAHENGFASFAES